MLLKDSEDGLILKKTTKPWISLSWNLSGMCLSNYIIKDLSIGVEKLCHTPMLATLFFLTFNCSKTIRK